MTWGTPEYLWLLWIIPVVVWLSIRAHFRRRIAASRFVDPQMVRRLMPRFGLLRPLVKSLLLGTGLTLLIISLARPRFGFYFEELSSRGVDVVVLLDVSKSMLAEDVKPNRLERARSDILDLLGRLDGDRVGLIVFAGAPVVQVPLTTDHSFFKLMLQDVDETSAPRGGTMIGDAIRKAMEAMEQRADRDQAIVIITDGGDLDSFPEDAARLAAERNLQIITVGLGDSGEGARIPTRTTDGGVAFVQHEGEEIWSRMDEALLKEIAAITNGAYIPAQTLSYDLGQIYDDQLSRLTSGEISRAKRRRYHERFQWFGISGLILLLIELSVSQYITSHATVPISEPEEVSS